MLKDIDYDIINGSVTDFANIPGEQDCVTQNNLAAGYDTSCQVDGSAILFRRSDGSKEIGLMEAAVYGGYHCDAIVFDNGNWTVSYEGT